MLIPQTDVHGCFCNALELVLHDLKQPLYAASLRVEALMLRLEREEWPVSPAATRREIESIHKALQDMNALTDSVVDVVRVEAGKHVSAMAAPADLNQLLTQTLQPFRDRAARAGVHLSLTTQPPLPEVYWRQRQMRCHVLNNLLANALHASPPDGWIEVSAHALGNHVEIRVSDEGPGIPVERRGKNQGRGGMGLYSARLFTRLHKGELSIEDGPKGQGTTLVLRLPANPFEEEPGSMAEAARGENPDAGGELTPQPAGLPFRAIWLAGSPKRLPLSFKQPRTTACRRGNTGVAPKI